MEMSKEMPMSDVKELGERKEIKDNIIMGERHGVETAGRDTFLLPGVWVCQFES